MKRPILRTAVVGFAAGWLCWAPWRLIRISKRWGATDSETVRDLSGDELLSQGRSTYAISIAAHQTRCGPGWCSSGVGGAASSATPLLSGSLAPTLTIWIGPIPPKPGERIWMTPERYLGHLPGQSWLIRRVQPGRALVLERKPPESPQRAIWSLVLQPAAGGTSRLLDRHRSEPRPGAAGSLSDAFWLVGTFLMERGMLRGIKARAEQSHRNGGLAPH
jgi:hypothetical protein